MVESSVSGAWENSNSFIEYIKMEHKKGMIFPRLYSALPTSTSSSFSSPPQKDEAGHRKKKIKRKFLLAVKAVLFETSFAKMIKKKAFQRKMKQAKTDPLTKVEKDLNHMKGNSPFRKFSKKSDGTSITSARSSISSAWSSRNSSPNPGNSKPFVDNRLSFESCSSLETKKKQDMEQDNNGKGYHSSNTGLLLLLVTLLVLVFWGKVYAILCTSTWLFFVPNSNSGKRLQRIKANSHSIDFEEYKKKIVMDRNRSRHT